MPIPLPPGYTKEMAQDPYGSIINKLNLGPWWNVFLRAVSMFLPNPQVPYSFGSVSMLRGPITSIPPALEKALGGGFSKIMRRGSLSQSEAKALQGRNPVGRTDIPSWEAMASTESPGGR